jgi:hypothetical protein
MTVLLTSNGSNIEKRVVTSGQYQSNVRERIIAVHPFAALMP